MVNKKESKKRRVGLDTKIKKNKKANKDKRKIKIAFISSEATPLIKVGGLADVIGSLPKSLIEIEKSAEVLIVLPGYGCIEHSRFNLVDTGITISSPVGSMWFEAKIKFVDLDGVKYYLVCCDPFYDREGIYGTGHGDYADNLERFSFFCKVVLELFKRIDFRPDIIHCNDWQTGLLPVFKQAFYDLDPFYSNTKVVFAIHNLAYQGLFPVEKFYLLGLDWSYFTYQGVEFYGKLNCLKAGLIYSDLIVTVSPSYAREIQTPEYGYGLDGVLRSQKRKIIGILNGIDYNIWDSWHDEFIYANFGLKSGRLYLKGKNICKVELLKEMGLESRDDIILLTMISRLVAQKGVDLAVDVISSLLKDKVYNKQVRFVLLGKGDSYYESLVQALGQKFPKLCRVILRFDEVLAHRLYAASDMILIPSRYEPCGLSQMISMRYGTIPIARRTGGLADTIRDDIGFLFDNIDASELLSSVKDALGVYCGRKKYWKDRIKLAMEQDFSWEKSAKEYFGIYEDLLCGVKNGY